MESISEDSKEMTDNGEAEKTYFKTFLSLWSVLYFITGGALVGMAVAIFIETKDREGFYKDFGNPYDIAICFIVVASICFCAVIVGFATAYTKSKKNGYVFIGMVFVALLGSTLSTALVWMYKEEGQSHLQRSLFNKFQVEYGADSEVTEELDKTMVELKCCGLTNYKDWATSAWQILNSNVEIPLACCKDQNRCERRSIGTTNSINNNSCTNKINTLVEDWMTYGFWFSLGVTIFQVFSFATLICMYKKVGWMFC